MTKSNKVIKYIDIAKIIDESDSGLLKKLPDFIIKWIAKIIKQDEINSILNKYSEDTGVIFLNKIVDEFNLKIEIEGEENLPENGKCFFSANHPFGVIDGLVLTHTVFQKYGALKAIANDAFMFVPQLHPLIAAVNVFGQSSKEYVKALGETYNAEIPITHFPAGMVSRRYKGKVQDPLWQKSFIKKAIESKRDIVPFYFYGRNSNLFYMIFSLRQFFKIETNIELMLLPREMFKKRNKVIKVKIGKPIPYQVFDNSSTVLEWAQKVRSQVYELGNNMSGNNLKKKITMKFNFRESMFRIWYWYVNKLDKNAEVLFLNYGFNDEKQELLLEDQYELNRYSIQLYHHLAQATEIKNKDIVEIGCGRGGGLSYITKSFSPASAKGVDIDNQAISFCKRNYAIDNLSFLQGDAQRLSLEDNSCDVVINVESSHRYPDMKAFLGEVSRILRPNGYFLFTDFRYDYEIESMKKDLGLSGLTVLNERVINKEVVAALTLDDERKRKLVKKLVPSLLHKIALNFSGTIGSETYNQFASNKYIYFSYVLKNEMT